MQHYSLLSFSNRPKSLDIEVVSVALRLIGSSLKSWHFCKTCLRIDMLKFLLYLPVLGILAKTGSSSNFTVGKKSLDFKKSLFLKIFLLFQIYFAHRIWDCDLFYRDYIQERYGYRGHILNNPLNHLLF